MSSDWWQTYSDLCRQSVTVKRYNNNTVDRVATEYPVHGNARQFSVHELVGAIQQGDWHVIVLAEDLTSLDFPLPMLNSDRVAVDDKDLAILATKARTDLDGNLVAYELQCRG